MLNALLAFKFIEFQPGLTLSTIVPWLLNVPPIAPLPNVTPVPDKVPLPELPTVRLPSSVPPLQLKLLAFTPATPFKVPLVKLRLGVLTATLKFAVPPEMLTVAGLIAPLDGVKFAVPPETLTPPVKLKLPLSLNVPPFTCSVPAPLTEPAGAIVWTLPFNCNVLPEATVNAPVSLELPP